MTNYFEFSCIVYEVASGGAASVSSQYKSCLYVHISLAI